MVIKNECCWFCDANMHPDKITFSDTEPFWLSGKRQSYGEVEHKVGQMRLNGPRIEYDQIVVKHVVFN